MLLKFECIKNQLKNLVKHTSLTSILWDPHLRSRVNTREGDGTPLQYSCLENPMEGGAWWAAVHGVTRSRARLSDFTFTFHFHAMEKEMATHSSVLAWRIPGTGEPGGLPSVGSHRVGHDWSGLAAAAAAAWTQASQYPPYIKLCLTSYFWLTRFISWLSSLGSSPEIKMLWELRHPDSKTVDATR